MKKSLSVLALEELLSHTNGFGGSDHHNNLDVHAQLFGDISSVSTSFALRNQEMVNGFSNRALADKPIWSTPKHSSISVTVDSQSSICAGSPMPTIMLNQALGATSRSYLSDDDDMEGEVGPCEQSMEPMHIKRIRRQESNRESARRSRKRKQAQLVDLESQVDQYRGENDSLFKQLADASQQYKDALTNNRVLKSDVEALRAKVKLAEDMVARGSSLTSSLSHLLQINYLNTPQSLATNNMCRLDNINVSPATVSTLPGEDSWGGHNATVSDHVNAFSRNGATSDAVSCVSDVWSWESHVPSVSK